MNTASTVRSPSRRALFASWAPIALLSVAQAAPTTGGDAQATPKQPWVHELVHHKSALDFAGGELRRAELGAASGVRLMPIAQPRNGEDDGSACYQSPPIAATTPFKELLASWNVDTPAGAGLWFEVRVGRARDDFWSEWMRLGEWGKGWPDWQPTLEIEGGKVDVDHFRSDRDWDRAQYRIVAWKGEAQEPVFKLSRVDLTFSAKDSAPPARIDAPRPLPDSAWRVHLKVPFHSQRDAGESIASRAACPTSLAMVMEFHGAKKSSAEVATRVYDKEHDAYGDWTRAVQGAYSLGVSGYLARFSNWDEAQRMIAIGEPIVIWIAVERGQLSGAPYKATPGHMLVLTGFDPAGDVWVNDPAAASEIRGRRVYSKNQLEECWLARGGTALVFLPKR
jgi:hypothetical protein